MSKLKIVVTVCLIALMCSPSAIAGRGCCSHHSGVAGCDTRVGRQICRDGTLSPSCTCQKIATVAPVPKEDYSEMFKSATILENKDKASFRKNKTALDDSYLKEAMKKPGAQKLPNGVIYFETVTGSGSSPASTDTVKVHIQGFYVTGKPWLEKRDSPSELVPAKIISCLGSAITRMKYGGSCEIVCPASTAFGDKGQLPVIYPGATLVYKLQLPKLEQR